MKRQSTALRCTLRRNSWLALCLVVGGWAWGCRTVGPIVTLRQCEQATVVVYCGPAAAAQGKTVVTPVDVAHGAKLSGLPGE